MSQNNGGAMMGGFLLGALVGGGLALLFAPRTGNETRRQLGATARRLQDGSRGPLGHVEDVLEEAAGEISAAIGAGKDAVSF